MPRPAVMQTRGKGRPRAVLPGVESTATCSDSYELLPSRGREMHVTRRLLSLLFSMFICSSALAQQTGNIIGKVTSENQPLPGVTVEARSNVLPQPRMTVTEA